MPTITQLEYIVTVDRLKHFGKAALHCHVSQPSLSMQIQKVEYEIGFPIFDRLKKPILPTQKGVRFIEQAKVVLKENEKLLALTKKDEKAISGDFKLAIIPTIAPYLLPLFIESFSVNYPKVKLKIDELKTETIIEDLKSDQLDAALLATPLNEPSLKETPLYYEPFYLYVGKDHPFAARKSIKESDLDGSDMWLLQDGHCLRNQVVKICSIKNEKGVFKNISFEGGNLETLKYLVQNSKSYTLIPELFVHTLSEQERKLYVKEITQPTPHREVSLVSRRDQWKSDILLALEETLLSHIPKNLPLKLKQKKSQLVGI